MIIKSLDYQPDASQLQRCLLDQDWPIALDSTGVGRFDIVSANPKQKITKPDWAQLQQALNQQVIIDSNQLPFCGGALGYFGYDANLSNNPINKRINHDINMPIIAVGIYDWAIITDHNQRTTVYVNQNNDEKHWQWLQQHLKNNHQSRSFCLTKPFSANQSAASYQAAFEKIKNYITAGDCYQVNLAQRFSAPYEGDAFKAYQLLRQHNPAPFSAFMRLEQGDIISCSPERFIQCHHGHVETKPIKGTRPRHSDPLVDKQLADELLNSEKDRAENLMIVDLLRNDLGRSCQVGSVKVPSLFALESYPAVHHLVSTVTGQLDPELTPVDLLQRAFPGGSITGAPKIRAMQIIEELEHYRRSIYCGSLGYISYDGNMDSNIAIRSCVASQQQIYCWAGGGIVADSTAEAEYQETLDKISRITATLNQTVSPAVIPEIDV
ncbi:MAG: aminodeoxychorismate synthase component I [Coxiellaceae bacterium]|nr:aminodeoxychorismate synthase component I [Coxiellaceae bacterium]